MLVDRDGELDFLDDDDLLLLARGAVALVLLVEELAVVLDFADGRDGVGRDLDEVEGALAGHLEGFERGHDAELLAVLVNDADFAGADAFVGADEGLCGTFIDRWNSRPPQRARRRSPCMGYGDGLPWTRSRGSGTIRRTVEYNIGREQYPFPSPVFAQNIQNTGVMLVSNVVETRKIFNRLELRYTGEGTFAGGAGLAALAGLGVRVDDEDCQGEQMKRRILLVDDEVAVLLTMKAVLEISGFDVDTAASAREGKSRLKTRVYDMVITDMRMESDEAGREVIVAARTAAYHPAVALLTAFPLEEEDALNMGADKMLVKATHTRVLLQQLDKLFESHEAKLKKLESAGAGGGACGGVCGWNGGGGC